MDSSEDIEKNSNKSISLKEKESEEEKEEIKKEGKKKTLTKVKKSSKNKKKEELSREEEEEKPKEVKTKSNSINTECNGIYISGIPYETKEEELDQLFSKYGKIEQIKLPKYQDSGRNIGYCHIYFSTSESAKKSLELDNYTLGKRYLKVSLAKMNSEELNKTEKIDKSSVPVDCLTAFIRNLPYNSTEKEVGDKFRSCGKIKGIRFVYNSKTKQFKGFCYIDFKEHNGLLKALELNGKEFNGRKLQVDFEQSKPRKGYKFNYSNLDANYNKDELNMLNRKRKIKNKK